MASITDPARLLDLDSHEMVPLELWGEFFDREVQGVRLASGRTLGRTLREGDQVLTPEQINRIANAADRILPKARPRPRAEQDPTKSFADILVPELRVIGYEFPHLGLTFAFLLHLTLDAARKIFEVNCLSALSWVQQAHRAWMGEHGGSVVNVSSVGGLKPAPGIGFYGASKAMLNHITQELAVELGPKIRVNAVAPAVVKTKFATALYEGKEQEVASTYPMKRLGVPEDIGSVVAFLLSEDAAWLTGQIVVIDGGLTLTGGV